MKHFILLFILLAGNITLLFPQKLVPTDQLALLRGKVTDFKGKALGKEIILLEDDNTKALIKITTDAAGKFEALVPVNATYNLKYKTFTTDVNYSKMVIPADKNATYEAIIKMDPPREFVLDNVYFDTGKATLKPSSGKALGDLVEVLKLKNTMSIEIQGHTDNIGSPEENIKLSQQRAEAVRKFLISKGIAAERIIAKGYGDSMPIADNTEEAGRSRNRRTSLKVLKE